MSAVNDRTAPAAYRRISGTPGAPLTVCIRPNATVRRIEEPKVVLSRRRVRLLAKRSGRDHEHSVRADARAERVDATAARAHRLKDLAPELAVAVERIGVVELVDQPRVLTLDDALDLLAHPHEEVGRDAPAVAVDERDLGAERAHGVELLLRERVRRDDRERVALDRAHERERRAGAPAGVLDDASAGPQVAAPLGRLDDRPRHAGLVATGRVAALELHEHSRGAGRHDPAQPHEGRAADGVERRGEDAALVHDPASLGVRRATRGARSSDATPPRSRQARASRSARSPTA
ncbi:hypothetical protein [Agrococcus sp. Marseille-Q4369]|uniref:hypothetical protein n=1 Tax=Agrococcus sp. Marseille-Q4369 TaxID=2810513 RepID=UPI002016628A|nr:hypothetical protein [Agrococcus sp. Marseille-Q4369]